MASAYPPDENENLPPEGTPYPEQSPPETYYDPGNALSEEDPVYYDPAAGQAVPDQTAYNPGAALSEETPYYGGYEQAAPAQDPSTYYQQDPGAGSYSHPEPEVPTSSYSGVYEEQEIAVPSLHQAPAQQPARRSSPASRKKPVKKAVIQRPASRKAAPRKVTKKPHRPTYGEGLTFGTVVLLVVGLALLAVVVVTALPRGVSGVGGYPPDAVSGAAPRNLLGELQQAISDRNSEMIISESEINQYVARRLSGKQAGAMGSLVKFRGVSVDISPGKAEITVERSALGLPLTMGVALVTEGDQSQTIYKPVAWYIGRIKLGERTLKPVVDLFGRLRDSLGDEYLAIQQMGSVRLEDDQVVFDSRARP